MNRQEQLLVRVMEECNELAQRVSKALIFGMDQVQEARDDRPDQNPERLTNRQRIYAEYYDLRAVLGMAGIDAWDTSPASYHAEAEKVQKVERYLQMSADLGMLKESK